MIHGLDDKDRKIINLLQQYPRLSQSEIAQHVDLSQPAAYFRIHKLAKKGFVSHSVGVDIKKLGIPLAKVDVSAQHPDAFLKAMINCPYVLDLYRMDGGNVFSLFIGSETFSTLDAIKTTIVNREGVRELHSHQIHEAKNGLIMPLAMVERSVKAPPCQTDCQSCIYYLDHKCLGCPHTHHYKGSLW